MAYHFKKKGSVATEIRRLACERIDKAVAALARATVGQSEEIHSARKHFKEMRALLKLVRHPLGNFYVTENRFYRNAGQELAPLRDIQVLMQSWNLITGKFPDLTRDPIFLQFSKGLQNQFEAEFDDGTTVIRGVLQALRKAHHRVADWPLNRISFADLTPGLRITYKRARRSAARACDSKEALQFHECRKRTRDLWCHATLLEQTRPDAMRSQCKQLKHVLDSLGQDHDLAVLLVHIDKKLHSPDNDLPGQLGERIRNLQLQLRHDACRVAASAYSENPKTYVRRISKQWLLWHGS